MATYTQTGNARADAPNMPTADFVCLKNYVNWTGSCAAGSDIAVLAVPAGFVLQRLVIDVKTAAATGNDCDFGLNGGDTDGFLDGVDMTSTGLKYATIGALMPPTTGGNHFAAADTIDLLTNGAALAACKFVVLAYGIMVRS